MKTCSGAKPSLKIIIHSVTLLPTNNIIFQYWKFYLQRAIWYYTQWWRPRFWSVQLRKKEYRATPFQITELPGTKDEALHELAALQLTQWVRYYVNWTSSTSSISCLKCSTSDRSFPQRILCFHQSLCFHIVGLYKNRWRSVACHLIFSTWYKINCRVCDEMLHKAYHLFTLSLVLLSSTQTHWLFFI